MLKKIGIGVVALLVVLTGAIATRPKTFRIERTTTIAAPPDVVSAYVNDFHQWHQWSPFENIDPNMKRTFGGNPAGVGATYNWAGNSQAGQGSMAIKESAPDHIAIDLHFQKPMEASNLAEFTFKPTAEGTSVTWSMSGDNNVVSKAMSLVMSMDKMVGGEFEKGLTSLKTISESEARRRADEARKASALASAPAAPAAPAK